MENVEFGALKLFKEIERNEQMENPNLEGAKWYGLYRDGGLLEVMPFYVGIPEAKDFPSRGGLWGSVYEVKEVAVINMEVAQSLVTIAKVHGWQS